MNIVRAKMKERFRRYKLRTGGKFSMRRKLLPAIRYSWEKLPEVDINVFHAKYHLSEVNLIRIALQQGVVLTGDLQKCDDCIRGKAKRKSVPKISSYVRATKFGERTFMDYTGPTKVRFIGGYRYFAVLIDDATRKKVTYLAKAKCKENSLRIIKRYKNEHLDPVGAKMKILRTDNDASFVNDQFIDYLCEQKVIREYTSEYVPQQNGIVEVAIKDIKNHAITLMNAANLHSTHASLYGVAVLTATDILNDAPHAANGFKSPNQMMKDPGKPLALRYQFGSHALVKDEHKVLLGNKVHECIFVGYTHNKPKTCLRFYKLSTKELIESQNYTVIDGMMLWNPRAHIFRSNDFFEVDTTDSTRTSNSGQTLADDETDCKSDETDSVADDDVSMDDLLILSNLNSLSSSEGENNNYRDNINSNYDDCDNETTVNTVIDDDAESSNVPSEDVLLLSDANHNSDDDEDINHNSDDAEDNNEHYQSDDYDENNESEPDDSRSEHILRRSNRLRNLPAVDYREVYHNVLREPNLMHAKVYLCDDNTIRVPKSYADVMKSPQMTEWLDAMKQEYECLIKNDTWEEVVLPCGAPVVGCRWVFDLKLNVDGSIKRYKARLVARGFSQTEGVDYFETFAPVTSMTNVRLLLALAAINDWDTKQLDIETAYLNAKVKEDIYMKQIPGFATKSRSSVLKLKRSLYGLKQSAKNWNDCLSAYLEEIGMVRSIVDPCLFYYRDESGKVALLSVYVDDLILTGNASDAMNEIVKLLSQKFKVKDFGEVHQILGMIVTRDRDAGEMIIHQSSYIRTMLKSFDLVNVRSCKTPTPEDMYAQVTEAVFNNDERTIDFDYRGAIGCLLYLANCTRPDIANGVRFLSAYVNNYTDIHVKLVKRMFKYLEIHADIGLKYDSSNGDMLTSAVSSGGNLLRAISNQLVAFSDASWADNYEDGTSNTGLCLMLGNCLIAWKSVKQRIIANSTMESEYIAMSMSITEVQDIRNTLMEIFTDTDRVVPIIESSDSNAIKCIMKATCIYGDNTAAITVGNMSYGTRRSRHINVRFHNVKNAVKEEVVKLEYIPTKSNKADFFTKCLGVATFRYLRGMFMGVV
jgi:Reverse transcriptase (RNA-dependent DNA polymerase)